MSTISNSHSNFLSKLIRLNRNTIDLHNNSFDFVRLVLALIVAYSHAPYVGGYGKEPMLPIKDLYPAGITWGTVAMYAFFVISGFLITSSFVNSKSLWSYLQKRANRIFPAFWVCLFVLAFGFSPVYFYMANGNFNNYFPNNIAEGVRYVIDNLDTSIKLRTVGNTLSKAVINELNGPIWSIIFEVKAYLLVAILGVLGFFRQRWLILLPFGFFWFSYYSSVFTPGYAQQFVLYLEDIKYTFLFAYFFAGATFFVFQKHVIWDWKIFVLMLCLIIYAVQINLFALIALIPFTYCILYLCQALPIRNLGRKLGDASYGVYIYHWAIQQLFFFLAIHKINPELSTWGSMIISIGAGYLSYHLVEKRFLVRSRSSLEAK